MVRYAIYILSRNRYVLSKSWLLILHFYEYFQQYKIYIFMNRFFLIPYQINLTIYSCLISNLWAYSNIVSFSSFLKNFVKLQGGAYYKQWCLTLRLIWRESSIEESGLSLGFCCARLLSSQVSLNTKIGNLKSLLFVLDVEVWS